MTRNQFISFFFIALLVFIVYQILLILSPFFRAIFWAAILAFAFFPVYLELKKRLRTHEIFAALLMTTVIFFIVVPPVVIVIANVTAQALDFYQLATTYIREGRLEQLIEQIRTSPFTQRIQTEVFQWEPLKQNFET
ncbi:MAG: hypothetical protein L0Y56_20525, partial [Nitrospira sp.]|nr:hypothetical protein [Nitrospira sp.]